MRNNLKLPIPLLFTLTEDIINGVTLHGVSVGITRNTAAVLGADLTAARLARDLYEAAAQQLRDKTDELKAITSGARRFMRLMREVLVPTFGSKYSADWNQTGLVGSLTIPSQRELLQGVVSSAGWFLGKNPDLEIAGKVTATIANQHHTALSNGRSALLAQKTLVKNLKTARDAKVRALVRRIRLFMAELGENVESTDPIWLSFGLNIPGIKARPETPENVSVELIGENALSVKWDRAPRAEYYRVWARVVSEGTELEIVGRPADLDFLYEDLPPGATVELALSAMNNGGESARTPVLTVQIGEQISTG